MEMMMKKTMEAILPIMDIEHDWSLSKQGDT
jgi:hypothetical protein